MNKTLEIITINVKKRSPSINLRLSNRFKK